MDIKSGQPYPSNKLSNFAPNFFIFDGVECHSMEGLLQAFKFKNPDMQKHVCTLVGLAAKMKGKDKNWYAERKLYWQGVEYHRDSDAYQELLDRAYFALAKSDSFRKALLKTGDARLTHSIGKRNPHDTILTQSEFCSRLMKIRNMIRNEEI